MHDLTQSMSSWRQPSQPITWLILTNNTIQENTQTKYNQNKTAKQNYDGPINSYNTRPETKWAYYTTRLSSHGAKQSIKIKEFKWATNGLRRTFSCLRSMCIWQPDRQQQGWWGLWCVDMCCRRHARCIHTTSVRLLYVFTVSTNSANMRKSLFSDAQFTYKMVEKINSN